ncbi:MAG: BamA/TamA family outer membrane protein, partial [Saprospiraceae bacterium]
VTPFGNSSAVPYIKQFYVGGPQSLRAWNIRELGPGNLNLSDSLENRQTYYAAGDFKLESSVEYRFDVIWRLKAALFLDVGNIWLLPKTSAQKGDGFLSTNFLDQIAVGTGFGLRFDLSYFLFRVDIGFKLRNPYLNNENRHWIFSSTYPVSLDNLFENYAIHIALDYPF